LKVVVRPFLPPFFFNLPFPLFFYPTSFFRSEGLPRCGARHFFSFSFFFLFHPRTPADKDPMGKSVSHKPLPFLNFRSLFLVFPFRRVFRAPWTLFPSPLFLNSFYPPLPIFAPPPSYFLSAYCLLTVLIKPSACRNDPQLQWLGGSGLLSILCSPLQLFFLPIVTLSYGTPVNGHAGPFFFPHLHCRPLSV